jgi:fatty acid desaturase
MKHHAHTNDPRRDPDHFIGGPFTAVIPKFLTLSVLQVAVPVLSIVPGGMRLLPSGLLHEEAKFITPYEKAISRRFMLVSVAVFVALSLAGFFWEALLLWYLPSRIGFFIVLVVFAWLPHHPHAERGRYRDTRITLFPGGTLLIRGQNHHLLHHLFPRVPHYHLPALFRELRPVLEAQGARIEGPGAGPGAPKIGLRWDPQASRSDR